LPEALNKGSVRAVDAVDADNDASGADVNYFLLASDETVVIVVSE